MVSKGVFNMESPLLSFTTCYTLISSTCGFPDLLRLSFVRRHAKCLLVYAASCMWLLVPWGGGGRAIYCESGSKQAHVNPRVCCPSQVDHAGCVRCSSACLPSTPNFSGPPMLLPYPNPMFTAAIAGGGLHFYSSEQFRAQPTKLLAKHAEVYVNLGNSLWWT